MMQEWTPPRFTIHEGTVLRLTELPTGGARVDAWTGSAWASGSLGDFASGVRATADDLRRLGISLDA